MANKTNDKAAKEVKFTEERIPVGDLEVDPNIQRYMLNLKKVERIVKNFNPAALGVISVSRRNPVTNIILDGWHRRQAVKELTDNQGEVLCHVYEGLTLAEEAQMFLDLNAGNQPSLLEKFRARLITQDPVAVGIDQIAKSYGWTIGPMAAKGQIQAIGALERIYRRSAALDLEPNGLQVAILVATRAWGKDQQGTQAVILEGLASLWTEHSSDLDLDRLVNKLTVYPGGPLGLHTDATAMASLRRGRVSMAVAELVTDEYNKGKQSKKLPPWRKRNP